MQLQAEHINDHIAYLDNGLLGTPGLGSTYLLRGDEYAIVETGTSLSAPHILDGLRRLGVDPVDVRHILLTHIHMDHAGGAGTLLPSMPDATVYIHSRTAKYLVDPTELLVSAERALGELYTLHGTVDPVPSERIVHADELTLDLGRDVVIRAIHTPGHSPDHLVYYEENSRSLFTGDSIGVMVPAVGYTGPVTPPPSINLDAQQATFARLLDLPIETLLFSHFGPVSHSAHALIEQLQERYGQLVDLVRAAWESGNVDAPSLVRVMFPTAPGNSHTERMIAGWVEMSVRGLVHTFNREAKQS